MKRLLIGLLLVFLFNEGFGQTKKPNIVLIVVDDMGYSDLGSYGSEIHTPNLDRLASQGLRLKEFYNNAICAPTRASILTGQDQHQAGIGYFDLNLGLPEYQGYLNKKSVTLAEVLRQNGYSTLMSGKWHVGNDSTAWPNQRGFEKFYGVIGGGANYFDAKPMPLRGVPYPVTLVENNVRLHPADNSYYFTDEIGNHALKYLDEQNKTNRPFFLYLAFNAPHWPLQALPEDIAKYKGRYDIGWDSLRKERLERQVKLGIRDPRQTVAVRDAEVPNWESLTYDEKQLWKAKMEVFAAMVDRMDQNVGKLLAKLKELKKDDNTLIVFISDNGAPAENVAHGIRAGRNTGPVGTAGSFEAQGKNWSFVSNSPLRSFKGGLYEGGMSSPFIAWFPGKIKPNTQARGTVHLIDLAPTFYELAGAEYPKTFQGTAINPLPGRSLKGLFLKGEELQRPEPLFWELWGNRAIRKGKWKLVSAFPANKWELYDIENDRGETKNLAAENPQIVKSLSLEYLEWANKNNVVLDFNLINPRSALEIKMN
ncbi:sulfatase-like hydrolase/transferase [Pedobacter sp. HMF7647]|uniref:Sulfatase-like hydrolase/transferase n=1 Tax=Hufsiella arboris TaxID=2695275 RepID=A0A7K1YBE0_9SPHI|nr:arylsulfatase [Hufsiella arboris]MXV51896.1 sulfatase-like hydrolase/transferase [Hufsiella arboris]